MSYLPIYLYMGAPESQGRGCRASSTATSDLSPHPVQSENPQPQNLDQMERAVTFDFLRASKRQKVTDGPSDTRGFQQVRPCHSRRINYSI